LNKLALRLFRNESQFVRLCVITFKHRIKHNLELLLLQRKVG
jgi:hypothetical protein